MTAIAMQDINTFWNSNAFACACLGDAPQICSGNAFAAPNAIGYLYYDPQLFQFVAISGMSFLPPAIILAHEFGHDIQYAYGLTVPLSISNELSADCFSGYFLGWLECNGRVNMQDVQAVFMQSCQRGDPMGVPWYAPGAHGTCQQRVEAVMRGVTAYSSNVDPIPACRPQ